MVSEDISNIMKIVKREGLFDVTVCELVPKIEERYRDILAVEVNWVLREEADRKKKVIYALDETKGSRKIVAPSANQFIS